MKATDESGASVWVDLGRVGGITEVRPHLIEELIGRGFIPVISPIGVDSQGCSLNVNADTAAGRIAGALRASKLLLMTDVEGVLDVHKQRVSSLDAAEAEKLIQQGVIADGMIPKVRCALEAVESGVEKVHIIDGRTKHALLLEIFTDSGVGTEIRCAEGRKASA